MSAAVHSVIVTDYTPLGIDVARDGGDTAGDSQFRRLAVRPEDIRAFDIVYLFGSEQDDASVADGVHEEILEVRQVTGGVESGKATIGVAHVAVIYPVRVNVAAN